MGYDMQTFYSYITEVTNVNTMQVTSTEGECLAKLSYIPGATIYKLNNGWKNRKDRSIYGFTINPQNGRWDKANQNDDGYGDSDEKDDDSVKKQRIVPYVEDIKNIMILRPSYSDDSPLYPFGYDFR